MNADQQLKKLDVYQSQGEQRELMFRLLKVLDFNDYKELCLDTAVFFTHKFSDGEPLLLVGKIVGHVLKKFSYSKDE